MKVKGSEKSEERPYILGKRGEEILRSVHFYLAITRFLVADRRWAAMCPGFRLRDARICYALAAVSVGVDEKGRREKIAVIPDAWLLFEKLVKGKAPMEFPVHRPHQVRHLFDLVLTHLEWDTGHTLPRQQRAHPCASWGRTQKKRP